MHLKILRVKHVLQSDNPVILASRRACTLFPSKESVGESKVRDGRGGEAWTLSGKEKEREGGRIKRWHRVSCTSTPGQLDTLAHYCYKEQSFPLSCVLVLFSDLLLLSLFLLHPRLVNPLLLKVSLRDAVSNIHTQYKCATLNTHTLYVYSRYCPDILIDLLHTHSACLHI